MQDTTKQFVDADWLAERFGVKVTTVNAWARRGWIPFLSPSVLGGPRLYDPVAVETELRRRGLERAKRATEREVV
jgi:hypothetical protein